MTMLQPSDRRHLFESLRPPQDYTLDCAIGTTFTLDLLALLTAPLAFTSFDWADEDDILSRSPQALLATMQQYADRISIFCQTGKIALPKTTSLLFSYLEKSVVEVNSPDGNGLFHPKVWVLRFTAPQQPVCYRLLCLSRNLTFDRSWDTLLLLDGQLRDTEFPENEPLSHFVRSLPGLAHHAQVPQRTQQAIDLIQQELRNVKFECPPGFQTLIFHPIGISANSEFPISGKVDRLLIISPFVSDEGLNRLNQMGKKNVLISRTESLDQLSSGTFNQFESLFQISPAANPEDDDSHSAADGTAPTPLVGLHAKLYVADAGRKARIWTGSANATDAAFHRNVEFLVELVGQKKEYGINALLAHPSDKEINFRSLLEPFTPPKTPTLDPDGWDQVLEAAQRVLFGLHLKAVVIPLEDDLNRYRLELHFLDQFFLALPADIQVRCYPLGSSDLAVVLDSSIRPIIEFSPLSCEAITSFIAFEVRSYDGRSLLGSCVMNVPIEGVPDNRRQRILKSLLSNKTQVLRLLMFLLTDSKADAREILNAMEGNTNDGNGASHHSYMPQFPLLESMVKALSRNPAQLDRINSLVKDLRQLSDDEQLLPDNFEEIWEPIYAVRQTLES